MTQLDCWPDSKYFIHFGKTPLDFSDVYIYCINFSLL